MGALRCIEDTHIAKKVDFSWDRAAVWRFVHGIGAFSVLPSGKRATVFGMRNENTQHWVSLSPGFRVGFLEYRDSKAHQICMAHFIGGLFSCFETESRYRVPGGSFRALFLISSSFRHLYSEKRFLNFTPYMRVFRSFLLGPGSSLPLHPIFSFSIFGVTWGVGAGKVHVVMAIFRVFRW